jgi:NADPH:quinone reductase-like Zn-dependent oxidoreductase
LLFDNSPAFLKLDGKFINVGAMEGLPAGIWSMAKNTLWPRLLGGTPRNYTFQQTNPDQKTMQYLTRLVEEEKLIVVIDKVFEMEDTLQVSKLTIPNYQCLKSLTSVLVGVRSSS